MINMWEIRIDKNINKIESVFTGLCRPSQKVVKDSSLFFQLDSNMSKMLLFLDILFSNNLEPDDFIDYMFFRSKKKKIFFVLEELLNKIEMPDWELKKNILEKKKKELKQVLVKNEKYIFEKLEKWFGYDFQKPLIYLAYTPFDLGGHVYNTKKPIVVFRVSNASKFDLEIMPLIMHEFMHIMSNKIKYKHQITPTEEEAIFDLMYLRVKKDFGFKVDWEKEIKHMQKTRSDYDIEIVFNFYKKLRPILHGKDDVIWDYIDEKV